MSVYNQSHTGFHSLSFLSRPLAEDGPAVAVECLVSDSNLLRFLGGGL